MIATNPKYSISLFSETIFHFLLTLIDFVTFLYS
jgi:hypothetical protein